MPTQIQLKPVKTVEIEPESAVRGVGRRRARRPNRQRPRSPSLGGRPAVGRSAPAPGSSPILVDASPVPRRPRRHRRPGRRCATRRQPTCPRGQRPVTQPCRRRPRGPPASRAWYHAWAGSQGGWCTAPRTWPRPRRPEDALEFLECSERAITQRWHRVESGCGHRSASAVDSHARPMTHPSLGGGRTTGTRREGGGAEPAGRARRIGGNLDNLPTLRAT